MFSLCHCSLIASLGEWQVTCPGVYSCLVTAGPGAHFTPASCEPKSLFSDYVTPSFTSRASAPDVIQQKMLSIILHMTCSQHGTTKSHSRDGENWLSCSIRPDSSSSSSSSSTNLNQHISKIGADIKMMRWHFQTALLHCLNHNNQLFNQRICWMTKTEN